MARCEVDGLRICRPCEGVDVLFSLRHGESFAAVGRDKIQLAWGFVFRIRVGIGVSALFRCGLALGEEGDPTTIGRPFGIGIVSRLRQLDQRAALAVVAIEPEVAAEDLLVPVGALGVDDNEVSVGRDFHPREVDKLKNSSSVSLGLFCALSTKEQARTITTAMAAFWIRIGSPVGRRVIQRRNLQRQACELQTLSCRCVELLC